MDSAVAARPFSGAVFRTLREKHNTFMHFLQALQARQQQRREEEQRPSLQPPDYRQDPLLRQLASSLMSQPGGLTPPAPHQDPLLRPLTAGTQALGSFTL